MAGKASEETDDMASAGEGVTVCVVGGCGAMAIALYPETPLCSEHRGASAEHRVCEEPHCYTAVLYGGRCKVHHRREPVQETSAPAEVLPDIAPPPIEQRPLVRHGDVAATLFNDLGKLFTLVTQLQKFEARVVEAATKGGAAWSELRQELAK